MIICGVKASHDGGVAVIDGSRLRFCVEVEKLANTRRYSTLGDLDRIAELLREEGCDPAEVDVFVVDGWFTRPEADFPYIPTAQSGRPLQLRVAPYNESGVMADALQRYRFDGVELVPGSGGYVSYHHASNHLLAAYCTSPFAERQEDALVLVWDAGMLPRLYRVIGADLAVENLGPLFPFVGNIFADFCSHFEPFWRDTAGLSEEDGLRSHLEIAGKAMAYAALGRVEHDATAVFEKLLDDLNDISVQTAFLLGRAVVERRDSLFPGMSNADLIATFQSYLGDVMLGAFKDLLPTVAEPGETPNLCLSGGCALNIKWNSQLRHSGLFRDVWVPPFPNDSGAAIGTACCELFGTNRVGSLEWNVYSGPELRPTAVPPAWSVTRCDEAQLAALLFTEGEPVVVLNGRAEVGPRALGNRSILATATSPGMKDRLNRIKDRASYRPVAPICLEERAHEVFDPGSPDPYMLFDHRLRAGWAERIPAVVHLDGTARLQTVTATRNPTAARVLTEYERLSGIPVLCNTSANYNGCGFFPDIESATEWSRTRYIWSDGWLYTNPNPPSPSYQG